jgi:prophage regulatory protein
MQTFIRISPLSERIDSSPSSVYRWISEGLFPPPIKIGPRAVAWRIADVEEWEEDPVAWRERFLASRDAA